MGNLLDYYDCAVCGRQVEVKRDLEHRCPKAVLSAIDSANTRAWNEEDSPSSADHPFWRTEAARISEGGWLLARYEAGEQWR